MMTRVLRSVLCAVMLFGVCLPASAVTEAKVFDAVTPEMAAELLTALSAIKAMIALDEEPRVEVVLPQKQTIDKYGSIFGYNETTIKAALDLVATYDRVKGPLFVARSGWDKGHRRKKTPPPNDLHWTMYHVMQYIFDSVYTVENIKQHADLLKGFSFGSHKHFPGPVEAPADPDERYETKISTWSPVQITTEESVLTGPRRPTGAYVAPGTVVTVVVPDALLDKGYRIRVGAHS